MLSSGGSSGVTALSSTVPTTFSTLSLASLIRSSILKHVTVQAIQRPLIVSICCSCVKFMRQRIAPPCSCRAYTCSLTSRASRFLRRPPCRSSCDCRELLAQQRAFGALRTFCATHVGCISRHVVPICSAAPRLRFTPLQTHRPGSPAPTVSAEKSRSGPPLRWPLLPRVDAPLRPASLAADASVLRPSSPSQPARALCALLTVRHCATVSLRNSPASDRLGCISRAIAAAITAQLGTARSHVHRHISGRSPAPLRVHCAASLQLLHDLATVHSSRGTAVVAGCISSRALSPLPGLAFLLISIRCARVHALVYHRR